MNLAIAFARTAEKHPDKTALYWGDTEYSFERLADETARAAAQLRNCLGVKPGDRVGLWLKNSPEFIPAVFGILQAGGVVIPINNFLKPAEVSFILKDAGVDLLVGDPTLAEAFPQLQSERRQLGCVCVGELFAGADHLEASATLRSQSDLAVIIYTSGTTGRPKGAMLSHGNLLHNVESCRLVLRCVDERPPGDPAADVSQLHAVRGGVPADDRGRLRRAHPVRASAAERADGNHCP